MLTASPPLDPRSVGRAGGARAAAGGKGRASTVDPAGPTIECDLCVVGGGVCGVSAALHAQRRGLKVEVLERGAVAVGASGRNAGFLMRGAADHYADAVRLYGRERARAIWRLTEQNLEGLRAEGVEQLPGYRRVPSCLLALNGPQWEELERSREMLAEDGFEVGWLDTKSEDPPDSDTLVRSAKPHGGLLNPNDGSCHPVELVRLLASKLDNPVREGVEVVSIERESGGAAEMVRVRCGSSAGSGGVGIGAGATNNSGTLDVRANRVLLCTNAYAGLLSASLKERVTPRRGQMLAIRGEGLSLSRSYYLNHGSEYVRQAADGTVVVGGCRTYFADREMGYDDEPTPWTQSALEAFAADVLGLGSIGAVRERVIARWGGIMGFSPTGLPIVEPVREVGDVKLAGDESPVWFCGGFTGHGMSMGFKTAELAVGRVCFGEQCVI